MTSQNLHINVKKSEDLLIPVLVAEDDEGLNHLVKKRLVQSGFTVETVFSGRDAVSHIIKNPETLMLLDFALLDMTGKEVIEEISYQQEPVPFIVMTGHGDEKTAVTMMKLGARDYLVKDATFIDRLIPVVKRISVEIGTERKLKSAETALRESEQRYRSIIDNSPLGIHIYKLEEDGSLVLTGSNTAADILTGIKTSDLIGKTIENAFPPLADTVVPDMYRRVASEGIIWNNEEIYYQDQLISGVFEVLAFQSSPGMTTVMFSNITEKKSVEEERLAREKLQGIVEAAGAICHEVNQPLQIISGLAELISIDLHEDDSLYQRTYKIKEQLNRIAVLTQKFKDVTRYKSKTHDRDTKILDVDEMQERRKYKRYIPQKGAVASFETESLKQVPLIDISEGGLGFYYVGKEDQLCKTGALALDIPGKYLTIEEIPYNLISRQLRPCHISSNNDHKIRVGLQFKFLKANQFKQLERFFRLN